MSVQFSKLIKFILQSCHLLAYKHKIDFFLESLEMKISKI